jgi:hypothetical protein
MFSPYSVVLLRGTAYNLSVSHLFIAWENTRDKQLERKKDLFSLAVSEDSAHDCLVSSLWAHGKTEYHNREQVKAELLISWWSRSKNRACLQKKKKSPPLELSLL